MTRRPGTRVLVRGALLVGFAALVALLYTTSLHAFAGDSDGATVALEGQAMRTGQVMLHGWALSLDSFWSVDAVLYMLTEVVTGTRGMLVYLVPAIIAALVIVVGAWLARSGRRGVGSVAAAGTVVALLAFPGHVLSTFFLRGPLHVGTVLLCLVAFAGLRSGRFGWGWALAVVCFAAGALGDFQMVALGMAPALAAGIAAVLRCRRWHAGVASAAAAGAGLVLAGVLRELADVVGTFSINAGHPRASASQMAANAHHVATWGANMLGVGDGSLGTGGVPLLLQLFHLAGLVVVVGGVAVAGATLVRGALEGSATESDAGARRVDDLLVLAFLADLVVFVALTTGSDPGFMRYLTGAVVFGSVLAGRWVGALAEHVTLPRLRRAGALAAVVVVAGFVAGLGVTVTKPRPAQPAARLGQFLEAHRLGDGIGDYWSASVTTVATNGVVRVRPVVTTPTGTVVRYERQSAADWYARQSFEFLVYDTARPWGGVSSATASRTFGPIARTYAVGTYRILVWDHPLSVSTVGFSPVPVGATSALPAPRAAATGP